MKHPGYDTEALIKRIKDGYDPNEIIVAEIWSLADFRILEEDGHDFSDLSKEDREEILMAFAEEFGGDSGLTTEDLLETVQMFREERAVDRQVRAK